MDNQAITILMQEHQLILEAMSVAEAMATNFVDNSRFHREHLQQMISFISNYADSFHHKKEEDVLFQWMAERGFPVEGGPIAMMLMEHDMGRELVASMQEALSSADDSAMQAVSQAAESLSGFAAHLRQHIYKEDNILYPMAMRLADETSDSELLQRYAEKVSLSDSEKMNSDYTALIAQLELKYV